MKIGLEQTEIEGQACVVGRDPRRMTQDELRAMGHSPQPVLKAIRARCLDCCAGNDAEVRRCVATECPSWPFRMGTNPWRLTSEARRLSGQRLAALRRQLGENA